MKKKVLDYTVIFEPAEEGGYVVSVPALPGCITQGETFEDAVAMAKDAIEGYLSVLNEEGKEIPEEKAEVVITKIAVSSPTAAF
ncbi:MAG: type II toxin-antitoxin system HicB family antitoxin [Candidatus Levyibacteriota bacterium]